MVYAVNAVVVIGTVAIHLCLELKSSYKSAVNYSLSLNASFVLTIHDGDACIHIVKLIDGQVIPDSYIYNNEIYVQAVKTERMPYLASFLVDNDPLMFDEDDFESTSIQLTDLISKYGAGTELVLDAISIE